VDKEEFLILSDREGLFPLHLIGAKKRTSRSMSHARLDFGCLLNELKLNITSFPPCVTRNEARWLSPEEQSEFDQKETSQLKDMIN
jgi:hypothetical protein